MNFIFTRNTPEDATEAQAWLRRARANATAAKVLVERDDPDLLIEAVTQVQQACEKAIKAILLAHGTSHGEVTAMGHNAIGAYVNLISSMLDSSDLAEEVSQALLTGNATEAANNLARVVLSGRRNKRNRDAVIHAFKQVLPPSSGALGTKAIEVEDWRRLTRAFPPKVVEMFIAFHECLDAMWSQYVNEIPNTYVDPRPLLAKEVSAETWVFNPSYAGLPRRFPGQESDSQTNPIMSNLAQQLLNDSVEQTFRHVDQRHWPDAISMKQILIHIGNWLTSLSWLFLCAIITTPHAVSSRYPAEEGPIGDEIGSQHYDRKLGVVACIGPLADHTETVVKNLITHFRHIEDGYQEMLR